MQDEKARKFFEEVLTKTSAGRISWEETAGDSKFVAAIGGQFTLSVFKYAEYGYDQDRYALELRDQSGRELTRITDEGWGIPLNIQELYEAARRQALRVDEKMEAVLGELSKL